MATVILAAVVVIASVAVALLPNTAPQTAKAGSTDLLVRQGRKWFTMTISDTWSYDHDPFAVQYVSEEALLEDPGLSTVRVVIEFGRHVDVDAPDEGVTIEEGTIGGLPSGGWVAPVYALPSLSDPTQIVSSTVHTYTVPGAFDGMGVEISAHVNSAPALSTLEEQLSRVAAVLDSIEFLSDFTALVSRTDYIEDSPLVDHVAYYSLLLPVGWHVTESSSTILVSGVVDGHEVEVEFEPGIGMSEYESATELPGDGLVLLLGPGGSTVDGRVRMTEYVQTNSISLPARATVRVPDLPYGTAAYWKNEQLVWDVASSFYYDSGSDAFTPGAP